MKPQTITILFLYTRPAPYLAACINELARHEVNIHLMHHPPHPQMPFHFELATNVTLHPRHHYNREQLIGFAVKLKPHIVFCSGWTDTGYMSVCRHLHGEATTVLLMDNPWRGTAKQHIWEYLSRKILPRTFSHIWIPGRPQREYARRLNFPEERIMEGFCCADTPLFNRAYEEVSQSNSFTKSFLFIGRYVPAKGLDMLIKAFTEVNAEAPNPWHLRCIGAGPLKYEYPPDTPIMHLGFISQPGLVQLLPGSGVFVLPSRYEPWGVVVQEMAAAGLPVIASDSVGATSRFVKHGESGFIFENGNVEQLKSYMRQMMHMDDSQLFKMAAASHRLGASYTPKDWVEKVFEMM